MLGRTADAAHFGQLADRIEAAFNARFLDTASGEYHTDRSVGYGQASNAIPLTFGLVPSGLVAEVAANLAADVRAHGNHLNTGDAGTKELLPALTENGYADLAFAVATQTTYPSWVSRSAWVRRVCGSGGRRSAACTTTPSRERSTTGRPGLAAS